MLPSHARPTERQKSQDRSRKEGNTGNAEEVVCLGEVLRGDAYPLGQGLTSVFFPFLYFPLKTDNPEIRTENLGRCNFG